MRIFFRKIILIILIIINCRYVFAELRILTSIEPPTNYIEDGDLTGITVDIVNELKKNLDIKTKIEVLPWIRAYILSQKTPDVIIFNAGKTPDRIKQGFTFIGPVTSRKNYLYKNSNNKIFLSTLDDVRKKKLVVGAMRGDWREKFMIDNGAFVESVAEHQQNIKKLISGRIDLLILSDLEISFNITSSGAEHDSIEPALFIKKNYGYIMISNGTSISEIKRWNKAFYQIKKTDFFDKTANKWSRKLNTKIIWSDEEGFHLKD